MRRARRARRTTEATSGRWPSGSHGRPGCRWPGETGQQRPGQKQAAYAWIRKIQLEGRWLQQGRLGV